MTDRPFGIEAYERKTPLATKALYIVAVLAMVVIYLTR